MLLTFHSRRLGVQRRAGTRSKPHSSKGARGKGLGVRASLARMLQQRQEWEGLEAWSLGFTRIYCSQQRVLWTAGGVQEVGAEQGQLSGTALPVADLWVPQLAADWIPCCPPEVAVRLGKEAPSLLKAQRLRFKWTHIGGHQPDTLLPAPWIPADPRQAGKDVPLRQRQWGVLGTHDRCQSPDSNPGLSGSKALWASRGGVKLGHDSITVHPVQETYPYPEVLGLPREATLDSRITFPFTLKETMVKSHPFCRPPCTSI